jgi:hypothetical protein
MILSAKMQDFAKHEVIFLIGVQKWADNYPMTDQANDECKVILAASSSSSINILVTGDTVRGELLSETR